MSSALGHLESPHNQSCMFLDWDHQENMQNEGDSYHFFLLGNFNLHGITGVVRTLHLKSSLDHGIEVVIHFYSRVWSHAYRQRQEALSTALELTDLFIFFCIVDSWTGYRGRRSPRGEFRKPRRRSAWCRFPETCSRGPSTSRAGAPDPGKVTGERNGPPEHEGRAAEICTYVSSHNIVGVVLDVPGQSEVTDLDQPALGHQDVPGRQVSMDTLLR